MKALQSRASAGSPSGARRYLEVLLFVALWMVGGWTFHLSANAYLLLGVPLLGLFQLGFRRQPLRKLWVRDAVSFQLGRRGILLAAFLMLVPGLDFLGGLVQRMWVLALWELCAMAGAVCAAFALREQRGAEARRAWPWFLAALMIGVGIMAVHSLVTGGSAGFPPAKTLLLILQFLSYFVVCFVLEEVVFRGALDSHLYQPSSAGYWNRSAWISAIVVSVLWGLWHLPMAPLQTPGDFGGTILQLVAVHTLIGVPLSFTWRIGGTLFLPAIAHALIDAYRNVIQ